MRIILGKKYDTPNIELYRIFNVLPIPLLHEMRLLQIVHKYYYHKYLLPEIFKNYFVTNRSIHQYQTRTASNLHISVVNSNFGQKNCTFRGSKYWNQLPNHLRSYSSVYMFKNNLKNYLLWR